MPGVDGSSVGWLTSDADEVDVRLVHVEPGKRIMQEVDFESDDPSFQGTMRMTWLFEDGRTMVQEQAETVPEGIRPEDHQVGLDASLDTRARFVEARRD